MHKRHGSKRSGGLKYGFSTGVTEKALTVPEKGFAAIGHEMGGKGHKGGFASKGKNKAVKTLLS